VIGEPSLAAIASLGFEPVDEINDVVEPAAGAGADAAPGNRDGEVGLASPGAADQDGVALLREEAAAGEIAHEGLIDRRTLELEVIEILGKWQLGDGELVFDRARLLLTDLGGEQITMMRWGSCWRFTAVAMISSKAAFMP
jgi:hypothetical protein